MMASYRSISFVALPSRSGITSCVNPGKGSRTSARATSSVPGAQSFQSGERPTLNVWEEVMWEDRSSIIFADDPHYCQVGSSCILFRDGLRRFGPAVEMVGD